MKRAKYFVVEARGLVRLLAEGEEFKCIEGIPKGSRILGVQWDILCDAFIVAVEHESFEEVGEGCRLPEARVRFKENKKCESTQ